jgi:site-specific recombinase XerD
MVRKQIERIEISRQISESAEHLKSKKYSKYTINNHFSVWKRFKQYAESKGAVYFSEALVAGFLTDNYEVTDGIQLKKKQVNAIRSMRILCDVFQCGVVSIRVKRRIYNAPSQFEEVFDSFLNFRRKQGYSLRTEQATQLYLERFGLYLDTVGVKCFADVSPFHLNGFVNSQFESGMTKSTVGNTLSILWGLFTFAAGKYHAVNLGQSMPKSGYRRNRPLPSTYSADEVKRLLKVVDRARPIGKRDYAILLLAAKLGIRTGDICNLQFSHFKWEDSRLEFVQGKTDKLLVLPILHEVGEAVIDYLKHGRPETESNHIFVRHQAPFIPFSLKSMNLLVKKHVLDAGIHVGNRKIGLHSLRHSLASSLLQENTPLPIISEVLGHTNTNTTRVYLKIDATQLKKCALGVPSL